MITRRKSSSGCVSPATRRERHPDRTLSDRDIRGVLRPGLHVNGRHRVAVEVCDEDGLAVRRDLYPARVRAGPGCRWGSWSGSSHRSSTPRCWPGWSRRRSAVRRDRHPAWQWAECDVGRVLGPGLHVNRSSTQRDEPVARVPQETQSRPSIPTVAPFQSHGNNECPTVKYQGSDTEMHKVDNEAALPTIRPMRHSRKLAAVGLCDAEASRRTSVWTPTPVAYFSHVHLSWVRRLAHLVLCKVLGRAERTTRRVRLAAGHCACPPAKTTTTKGASLK